MGLFCQAVGGPLIMLLFSFFEACIFAKLWREYVIENNIVLNDSNMTSSDFDEIVMPNTEYVTWEVDFEAQVNQFWMKSVLC